MPLSEDEKVKLEGILQTEPNKGIAVRNVTKYQQGRLEGKLEGRVKSLRNQLGQFLELRFEKEGRQLASTLSGIHDEKILGDTAVAILQGCDLSKARTLLGG